MTTAITGLSSMATRPILAELVEAYEQRTGRAARVRSVGGVEAARLIRAGEPFDLVILASGVMERLEAEGYLIPGSRMDFAQSGIAIAVPSGAQRPDLSHAEAVRQAVLKAQRICYSTGPSGDHVVQLLQRWNMADVRSERAVQAPAGVPVGAFLARGEADLGFQQLSELLHVPGVDIVGPLPPEIQSLTVFTVGIARASSQPDAARALAAYLASPEAATVKRQHGMEPA
jgi:molybdate transport system substrate-binding protein